MPCGSSSHEPDVETAEEYRNKTRDERHFSHIPSKAPIIFLEVLPSDSSDFEEELEVRGVEKFGYRVLQVRSNNVPGTAAAVLLEIRNVTGIDPRDLLRVDRGQPAQQHVQVPGHGQG